MSAPALPLPAPAMLARALGYRRGARYVAFWWNPVTDGVAYSDGTTTAEGSWWAWLALVHHPVAEAALAGYDLGSSEAEGGHRLLLDRWELTLSAGEVAAVQALLDSQPGQPAALLDAVPEEEREQVLEELGREHRERAGQLSPEEAEQAARERAAAVEAIHEWLDGLAGAA